MLACKGELIERMDDPRDLPACTEVGDALALSPAARTVGEGGLVVFEASGGTGAYRFAIATDESGGRIEESTGLYVAGTVRGDPPTVDTVVVTDRGCSGEASSEVTVVDGLRLMPAVVEVRPGGEVTFEASGGSGRYRFELVRDDSGATLDNSRYRAGSAEGRDQLRVFDEDTLESADAIIDVRSDAGLRLQVENLVLPLGTSVPAPVDGGSGELELRTDTELVALDEGRLTAAMAGSVSLTLADRFTGD
ncbi:MAG: hypothetical protein AAGE52_38185, partial [Myxococcota bacterium]